MKNHLLFVSVISHFCHDNEFSYNMYYSKMHQLCRVSLNVFRKYLRTPSPAYL